MLRRPAYPPCWAIGLILVGTLFPIHSASAMLTPHYDLSSLVLMSEHVVLAERLKQPKPNERRKSGFYRIKKVYRGSLRKGQEILLVDEYQHPVLPLFFEHSRTRLSPPKKRKLDRDAVLFLESPKFPSRQVPKGVADGDVFRCVSSGMRLLYEGRVYRFVQWSNPGGLQPVPQGRDPFDVRGAGGGPVGFATFEIDLKSAIENVVRFYKALRIEKTLERRENLLSLLGPVEEFMPFSRPSNWSYAPVFSGRVIGALQDAGDFDGYLEAITRERKWLRGPFHSSASVNRIEAEKKVWVDAALDESRPLRQRQSTLWLLGGSWANKIMASDYERLQRLLHHKSRALRIAAARALGSLYQKWSWTSPRRNVQVMEGVTDALSKLWQTEKDPLVRGVILHHLWYEPSLLGDKEVPDEYLLAHVKPLLGGKALYVEYVYGGPDNAHPLYETLLGVVRRNGQVVDRAGILKYEEELTKALTKKKDQDLVQAIARTPLHSSGTRRVANVSGVMIMNRPLAPGRYEFLIEGLGSTFKLIKSPIREVVIP